MQPPSPHFSPTMPSEVGLEDIETDLERYASSLRTSSSGASVEEPSAGVPRAFVLDARSPEAFARVRLAESCNVVAEEIRGAGAHALPPRTTPFLVLASTKDEALDLARFLRRGDFKGVGWDARAAFAGDDNFFAACEKIDLEDEKKGFKRMFRLARGEPRADERLRLWEPSPEFSRWLPEIERRFPTSSERPTCVDFGSGAGRDAIWAASRGWNVVAIDNDPRGLARCADLARFHGVDERVRAVLIDLRKLSSESVFEAIESVISSASWAPVSLAYAVRYLHKPLVRDLTRMLPRRCAACWFHFMRGCESTAVGRPSRERDLLEPGELRGYFPERDWTFIADDVAHLPDGRPISVFAALRAS